MLYFFKNLDFLNSCLFTVSEKSANGESGKGIKKRSKNMKIINKNKEKSTSAQQTDINNKSPPD
jgi:hypothetical protein